MEHFFYDEHFCSDIDDFISCVLDLDKEGIKLLPDEWEVSVELTELQPIFKIDMDYMVNAATNASDQFEERFAENWDNSEEEKLKAAFAAGIDVEKINAALPKYYYPNGKKAVITKQDLLDNV